MNNEHAQEKPAHTNAPNEERKHPTDSTRTKSRISAKVWIPVVVIVLAVGIGFGMTQFVYAKPATDGLVRKIVGVFPYPAVKINDRTLTIQDYLIEHDALISFYNSFEDPEALERPDELLLEQSIIDTMINKNALELLAEQHGVTVDQAKVDEMFDELLASSESQEAFASELQETFGWSQEEFKAHVVEPIVLASQMSEFVAKDAAIQMEQRQQAQAAYARLEAGEEFGVVASETNDDRSAIFGGDLGYLLLSELPVEWLASVESLETDEYSEVIESDDGFAILSVTDRITVEDDEQVQLSAILVRKRTVEDLVAEYLEEAEITRYLGKLE